MEEDLTPFGFMDVGLDIEFIDSEGNRWEVVDDDEGFSNHGI